MENLKINEDGEPNSAYILPTDLHQGKFIIYLGGDVEELDRKIKTGWTETKKKYGTASRFLEDAICETITHESIHIVIFKLFNDIYFTRQWDWVDNIAAENRPSGCGLSY